jgi:hypothetical protein
VRNTTALEIVTGGEISIAYMFKTGFETYDTILLRWEVSSIWKAIQCSMSYHGHGKDSYRRRRVMCEVGWADSW